MMRIFRARQAAAEVARIAGRSAAVDADAERTARRIIAQVRRGGDDALQRLARRFDRLGALPLRVPQEELDRALCSVSSEFRTALETATCNIRQFCQWQKPAEFRREILPGIEVGQIVRPLASVGCYVPGGRYPLPSSVLMTVIPAQVAGVQRIAVASPSPALQTLAAAAFCGVKEFYRIGGAQAIAALAYGTKTIPRTDKVVGPGNKFVTAAKKQIAFDCGIEFLAGPSEVLIVSERGEPRFIAADLIAQAEHDPDACAIFVTSSPRLATEVKRSVTRMAANNTVACLSLKANGKILVSSTHAQAIAWANAIGPEHVTVSPEDVEEITSAGAVFVSDYSPQAVGDYAAGPNHVLPTGNIARWRGGLSVSDFVKVISVQQLSREGLQRIAPVVEILAQAEGLKAHAESVRVRCAHA
jgi:histidinol dehydrogenase